MGFFENYTSNALKLKIFPKNADLPSFLTKVSQKTNFFHFTQKSENFQRVSAWETPEKISFWETKI